MNVAIVGSRDYPHPEHIWSYVATLPADTVVVSGGARGVDSWAAAAATRHGLPLIGTPDFAGAGALMSYMFDPVDLHVQAASYIDRILRGASPADLPVQQPTKYSLVINLKTAKALGLTVPPSMLDLADEVIE